MRQTIYRWRPGSRMRGSAQHAGEIIERLQQTQGKATPEEILKVAKPADSPLHSYFEWDNSVAAHKFRLQQAADLVRSIDLVRVDNMEAPPKARAFASVVLRGEEGRSYVHVKDALSDPEYRGQLLTEARQEMESFRVRYAGLQELARVFSAIKKVTRRGNASRAMAR